MPSQKNRQRKGHRKGGGRTVVRLDAAALFERLDLLGRSQNWLARQIGVSPGLPVEAGQRRAIPPPGASAAGCSGPWERTRSRQLFKTEDEA